MIWRWLTLSLIAHIGRGERLSGIVQIACLKAYMGKVVMAVLALIH